MTRSKNKKLSEKSNNRLVLKVNCYTPISKPLNGSLPRSNNSHLLRLYPISYYYGKGKDQKEALTESYYIKGLRGAIRHSVMHQCRLNGLEVCHSSDKKMDKSGNNLLPEGFHLLGDCAKNGSDSSCIVNQIFGSKGQEGLISVFADPITSISHKTAKLETAVQKVHIATENRVNMTYDGKTIQDFGERYFSGFFSFEIDVTKCSSEQMGLLIESAMNIEKIGRGFNSGYGHVKIESFHLIEREIIRKPEWNEEKFILKEVRKEKTLKKEVLDSLKNWKGYLEAI